ncbi:DNA-3-methyladenine glycosylase 2 family protein [Methylophilaceae bacterium]|nr:DNA-3-methyladenine glycosylase 2 family protein [Methylophilaceae bacterium]
MQESILIGSEELCQEGATFLSLLDDDWNNLVSQIGTCTLKADQNLPPYQALIKSVTYQQLHPKAANTILGKFLKLFNGSFPTANNIFKKKHQLKECGLSKNKCLSILDIAWYEKNQLIPSYVNLLDMKNENIIEKLTAIKGIGKWTAEMFLIFHLGRIDVMPSSDLALRNGYRTLKSLEENISPKDLAKVAELWSPFRSIAAWYLWRKA